MGTALAPALVQWESVHHFDTHWNTSSGALQLFKYFGLSEMCCALFNLNLLDRKKTEKQNVFI